MNDYLPTNDDFFKKAQAAWRWHRQYGPIRHPHSEPLTKRERVSYLTGKSAAYTAQMMQRWDKLFRLIAVKHNDQIMKPSENGTVVPGRYTTPGYDQQFREQISKDTGTRYLMPESSEDIKSL